MKRLYEILKGKVSNKKGASNLEVIIVMAIALVIGGALFVVGNTMREAASSAAGHAGGMQESIEGANFDGVLTNHS